MLKKKLWLTAMLSLLLVACQDEANQTEEQKSLNVEENEAKQEGIPVAEAEDDLLQYEWKTAYQYVLNRYIDSLGFFHTDENPFSPSQFGVAAVKIIESNENDMPYLAILYVTNNVFELDKNKVVPYEEDIQGIYFDIWTIQDGEPVRIKQEKHWDQGTAGDLSLSFVETIDGEMMLHYGTQTSIGELHGYLENYYSLEDLENPTYLLNHFRTIYPDGTGETTFVVNEEVSEREYEEKRKKLMGSSIQWIASDLGAKSISDEVAPIIPNVLDVLESLQTENVEHEELLAVEKQAIYDKLVNVNFLEENLTDNEKVEYMKNMGGIPGGTYSYSEQSFVTYPKRVMDYFTQSYFGFTLDETTFASEYSETMPSFKDDVYVYPIIGDRPYEQDVYVLDIVEIEKLEGALYGVKYEEKFFDFWTYGDYDAYPYDKNVLSKSDLPEDANHFFRDQRTGYAIFEKNKYGFAIIEDSTTPTAPANEKEEYLASPTFTHAVDLIELHWDELDYQAAYKAWDDELNKIYGMLREKLPPDQMEALKIEQRQWIKYRDAEAKTPEEVGVNHYFFVMQDRTMERTYELVYLYFNE